MFFLENTSLNELKMIHLKLQNGSGDVNDVWRLHIPGARQGEVLQTLRHEFQLVHNRVRCLLTTTKKHLPKW